MVMDQKSLIEKMEPGSRNSYNLIMKNTKDHKTLTLEPTKSRPIRPRNQIFFYLIKSVATQ